MTTILPLLDQLQPELPKTTCRQLQHIVVAMLAMTGRITQLGLSRWTDKGASYRTIQRFFHTNIDWLALKWRFFELFCLDKQGVYLLAGDETVITKSGKHTFGIDRFFSSLFDKAIQSIACFSMALIHVGKRQAYSLSTEQVVRTDEEKQQAKLRKQASKNRSKKKQPQKPVGRPAGSTNKNKAEVVLNPELLRILAQAKKLLKLIQNKIKICYFVLDGHFGNHYAAAMAGQLGLFIISKMRADAALFLLPTADQKHKQPRKKYGTRLDYANLPEDRLCWRKTEHGYCTEVYQAKCLHKDFAEPLNVVIVVKTQLLSGRRGHVVLFSTDLSLAADLLVDYYTLRFQIEFTFRDAKQHFGLEDWMGVSQTCVANGIGLSLFMVNLSSYLLGAFRLRYAGAGILDLKGCYRGRHYLDAVLKLLADQPDAIVCGRLLDQISQLGSIHGRSQRAPDLEMAA